MMRDLLTSCFLGGVAVLIWKDYFAENPTITKSNAFVFSVGVTMQFAAFFVPIMHGLQQLYKRIPFYTVHVYRYSATKLVFVQLENHWFDKPNLDNALEEPVLIEPPKAWMFPWITAYSVFMVFIESIVTPFARMYVKRDDGTTFEFDLLWLLFSIIFIVFFPLFFSILFLFGGGGQSDEARRLVCEHEAKCRLAKEIREILGEKV